MQEKISISNKTRGKLPDLPFVDLKNDILGKRYNLSIAFVDEKTSREVNKTYRGKDKPTDVLSFPFSDTEGEILLCMKIIRSKAKDWDKTVREFTGFLVIHGMLHLKGMDHGSIMEKAENKYDQKYFYRNRPGDTDNQSRGGRVRKRRKSS